MTKTEWKPLAALLVAYYPNSFKIEGDGDPNSDATKRGHAMLTAWYDGLADLPAARVHASILHMVRTQPAFPSIADIRKHAEAGDLTAATAWAEVIKEVGRIGRGGLPCWTDARIGHAVAALGGWSAVCDAPTKDHPTMRAQFRQAFEGATEIEGRKRTFEHLGVPTAPPQLKPPQALKGLLADVSRPAGEWRLDPEALRSASFELWKAVEDVAEAGYVVHRPKELEAAQAGLGKALGLVF